MYISVFVSKGILTTSPGWSCSEWTMFVIVTTYSKNILFGNISIEIYKIIWIFCCFFEGWFRQCFCVNSSQDYPYNVLTQYYSVSLMRVLGQNVYCCTEYNYRIQNNGSHLGRKNKNKLYYVVLNNI